MEKPAAFESIAVGSSWDQVAAFLLLEARITQRGMECRNMEHVVNATRGMSAAMVAFPESGGPHVTVTGPSDAFGPEGAL